VWNGYVEERGKKEGRKEGERFSKPHIKLSFL
jgi:hypothetical protein